MRLLSQHPADGMERHSLHQHRGPGEQTEQLQEGRVLGRGKTPPKHSSSRRAEGWEGGKTPPKHSSSRQQPPTHCQALHEPCGLSCASQLSRTRL